MDFEKTVNMMLESQYSWFTRPIERMTQEVGKRMFPRPPLNINLAPKTPDQLAKMTPSAPLRTQAEYEADWKKEQTRNPSGKDTTIGLYSGDIDFSTPGFSTQKFDQSLQQIQQANPSFDSQTYGNWAKSVVTGMMESERIAGKNQQQMEKTFQDELQRYINMAPQYIKNFQAPAQSQQNFMGSSPQVVGTATKSSTPNAINQHANTGQWYNRQVGSARKY
jgi:hypothetical protein